MGIYTGREYICEKESPGWKDIQAQMDESFLKFKNDVIQNSCVGNFDTDYFKGMVGVIVDYNYSRISEKKLDDVAMALKEQCGMIDDQTKFTIYTTQDGSGFAVGFS